MQIELRLLAYYMAMLGDPSMADVIKAGSDLHTESAMAALHLTRDPTDEERQVGKVLNFSIVYGGGRPTIMKQLNLEWFEAGQVLQAYHSRWPGIALVGAAIDQTLAERGYIKTLWGRHLHPDSPHKALNALVQGCAADLMKAALIKTHRWLRENQHVSHLVLTTHDELVTDTAREEVSLLVAHIPELMIHQPVHEVVPIGVDVELSFDSWADKSPYEEAYIERERLVA